MTTFERPPFLLTELTVESRGIEKLAEQAVYDLENAVDALLTEALDVDLPIGADDETMDAYLDARRIRFMEMVISLMNA